MGQHSKRELVAAIESSGAQVVTTLHALPPEQIRQDAGNDAVREHGIGRDEKTKEPGMFPRGGRVQACCLLQGGFLHANDVSMSVASSGKKE